jgi:hypothetical protein
MLNFDSASEPELKSLAGATSQQSLSLLNPENDATDDINHPGIGISKVSDRVTRFMNAVRKQIVEPL